MALDCAVNRLLIGDAGRDRVPSGADAHLEQGRPERDDRSGWHAFANVASLEQVFALVTDAPPPSDIQAVLEAAGTLLIVVPDDGEAGAGRPFTLLPV